jgi:hypothetical protein
VTAGDDAAAGDGRSTAVRGPMQVEIGPMKPADPDRRDRQLRAIVRLLRRAADERGGHRAVLRDRRPS